MTRKIVAAVAVAVEFAIVAGIVIPALRLRHQGALVQLLVIAPYLVVLKATWNAIARNQSQPSVSPRDGCKAAATIDIAGRVIRSRPLIVAVAVIVVMLVAYMSYPRYRVLTTDKTLFRFDRYTGRCERLINTTPPHFVPVLEHDEVMREKSAAKSKRASSSANRGSNFSYSKSSEDDKREQSAGFNLTEFLKSGETLK